MNRKVSFFLFFYLILFFYNLCTQILTKADFVFLYSRPSKTKDWDYDFFVDFDAIDANQVSNVVEGLRKHTKDVRVIGADSTTDSKFCCLIPV